MNQSLTTCQICSSPFESILFLGDLPPVNTMLRVGSPRIEQVRFPLELVYCKSCSLMQINFSPDPSILFPPDYPYTTGTTKILRDNFKELADKVFQLFSLKSGDLVVDIGSNDGTLLSNFKERGVQVLGIDPTDKADLANERGIRSWKHFFDESIAKKILKELQRPRLVTAANVFAHIPKPLEIAKAIAHLVGDGIFINESHYLLGLIQSLQYDTIYHEHLRYYSLKSMKNLLEKAGLIVFKVEKIPTHGGSIRVYSSAKPPFMDPSVDAILKEEEDFGLFRQSTLEQFSKDVLKSKIKLLELLHSLKGGGHSIFGVGAPSRASTIVNYCGLSRDFIECVVEVSGSHKIGKYMPGSNIPVADEKRLYEEQPPYALLFSWHISAELIGNLVKRGFKGDFIVPLPVPKIVKNPQNV